MSADLIAEARALVDTDPGNPGSGKSVSSKMIIALADCLESTMADLKSATASYRAVVDVARTFGEHHDRFHPHFWCADYPDKHCYGCDFGAALRALNVLCEALP